MKILFFTFCFALVAWLQVQTLNAVEQLENRTKNVKISASCIDSKGQPCDASFYVIGAKVESGKGE